MIIRDLNPLIATRNWERRKNFCLFLYGYKLLTRVSSENVKALSEKFDVLMKNGKNGEIDKTVNLKSVADCIGMENIVTGLKNVSLNAYKTDYKEAEGYFSILKVFQNINLCTIIVSYM